MPLLCCCAHTGWTLAQCKHQLCHMSRIHYAMALVHPQCKHHLCHTSRIKSAMALVDPQCKDHLCHASRIKSAMACKLPVPCPGAAHNPLGWEKKERHARTHTRMPDCSPAGTLGVLAPHRQPSPIDTHSSGVQATCETGGECCRPHHTWTATRQRKEAPDVALKKVTEISQVPGNLAE